MSAGDVRGWAASAARLQDGALDVGDRLLRHHYVVVAATITAGGVVSDEGQPHGRGGGVSDEGDRGAAARQGGGGVSLGPRAFSVHSGAPAV